MNQYEKDRNSCIPKAERYAYEVAGVPIKFQTKAENLAYAEKWNRAFFTKMDELANVACARCPTCGQKIQGMIIIIFFLLFSAVAQATEIEVAVSPGKSSYHTEGIKPGNTLRLTVLQNGYYIALENENFMLYGQDMAIQSLSVGYRHQFKTLPFFIYGQGGYYRPDYDPMGFGKEAIYAEQARQYGFIGGTMPWSDHYRLEFRPDFGAEIGTGMQYRIYDAISVDLSIGYRYLRMWADYDGLDSDGKQFYIMSRSDNFSAVKLYGGINLEF